MVDEVNRQLAELHDLDFVPSPYSAAYIDWGDDPYGGGWNSWNIGVRAERVSSAIVQPEPEEPVYICGEAYSHYQGWVEGALSTARTCSRTSSACRVRVGTARGVDAARLLERGSEGSEGGGRQALRGRYRPKILT